MLVFTTIPPRLDGTLIANAGGKTYVFKDQKGFLTCEVPDDDALELLRTGNFFAEYDDERKLGDKRWHDPASDEGQQDQEGEEDFDGDDNGPLIEESVFSASAPVATSAKPRGRPRKSAGQ